MNRRGFFAALLASAVVVAASTTRLGHTLIEVVRDRLVLHGDGLRDDTDALQAFLDGGEVYRPSGELVISADRGSYLISDAIYVDEDSRGFGDSAIHLSPRLQERLSALPSHPPDWTTV